MRGPEGAQARCKLAPGQRGQCMNAFEGGLRECLIKGAGVVVGARGGAINLFQMILIGRCQGLNDVEVADQSWVLGQRTAGTLQQLGGQRVIAQLGM